jgi:Ca2+-transporting ATPase
VARIASVVLWLLLDSRSLQVTLLLESLSSVNFFHPNFLVVAVPEGLPLAVTISLAFSMFKMMKDKCFVRQLAASETMGQATCICTDKTGTLTENRMTVVKIQVGDNEYNGEGSGDHDSQAFSPQTLPGSHLTHLIAEASCVNSTCFIKYKENNPIPLFVGSATEGAMLVMSNKLGYEYEAVRKDAQTFVKSVWAFSSERKRMSTLAVPVANDPRGNKKSYRLYTKGASEVVLALCNSMVTSDGANVVSINEREREKLEANIKEFAGRGLRTIGIRSIRFNH